MTELNQVGFERLLELLDVNRDQSAEQNNYLNLCRRLNFYFERKGVHSAQELTDETISRVTQKLARRAEKVEEEIRNIVAFCQEFANLILLEHWRSIERQALDLMELPPSQEPSHNPGMLEQERQESLLRQQRFGCMRQCLQRIRTREHDLVTLNCTVDNREELARKLGITIIALRMRVFHIRKKLRQCVVRCMKKMA